MACYCQYNFLLSILKEWEHFNEALARSEADGDTHKESSPFDLTWKIVAKDLSNLCGEYATRICCIILDHIFGSLLWYVSLLFFSKAHLKDSFLIL